MSKDDRELIELTKPQEAADTKLADLFPEWEFDQRQCIAAIVADAVLAAARLETPQAQPARGAISVALAPIYARIAVARENAAYNGSYAGGDAAASAKRLLDEASEAILTALTASPPVVETTDE